MKFSFAVDVGSRTEDRNAETSYQMAGIGVSGHRRGRHVQPDDPAAGFPRTRWKRNASLGPHLGRRRKRRDSRCEHPAGQGRGSEGRVGQDQ